MIRKLLLVSLSEPHEWLPRDAYLLLGQRLVWVAATKTRSLDVLFWDCPELAESMGQESYSGHPDLSDYPAVVILGSPSWLQVEATFWTEQLIPYQSLTGYISKRIKPVSLEVGRLINAGFSPAKTEKFLEAAGSIEALVAEAERVRSEVANGGKITQVGEIFRFRKDVDLMLNLTDVKRETIRPVSFRSLL